MAKNENLPWTDERIETARAMWVDGKSAGEIANALGGGLTRSGVIGKVRRLGLIRPEAINEANRRSTLLHNRGGRKRKLAVKPKPTPPPASTAPDEPAGRAAKPDPDAGRTDLVPLLRLGKRACRWPIKFLNNREWGFCGHDQDGERPYCAEHNARAFAPTPPRGVARRNSAPELARMARNFA